MKNILITGGTGLIGRKLAPLLTERGYSVSILSRSNKKSDAVTYYKWDIEKQEIETEAIAKANYIIHLAGANVGEGRWTTKRKKEIIDSRIKSGDLLLEAVKEHNPNLKAFISSSAVGYYGMVTQSKPFVETDPAGSDFLAQVCDQWEKNARQFNAINIRTVIIRTGVVLDATDGALAKLLTPIRLGIGSAIGSGKQAMPWIHHQDICKIYLQAVENESMTGAYNGVSPEQVSNYEFSKHVAQFLSKPFWFPKVPVFVLKLILGEQAIIALEGSPISSKKIEETGFEFDYPTLELALEELL